MVCRVKLSNKINSFEITLNREIPNINEQVNKEVIYQNQAYEIIIEIEENIKEIENIELYINNESIKCRFRRDCEIIDIGKFKFPLEYIFSTIFGFADIAVEITYVDKSRDYYYSEYISVAIDKNNEESLISIQQMIDYIYEKNSDLLYSSSVDRVSNISTGTEYSENRAMDTEIILLNQIITSYNTNLKYFMSDLKYKIVSYNEIDDFKKLRKIGNDTIRFIAANPEKLVSVNHITGINYNGQNFEPVKTLISKNYNCCDIYENRIVLGFLKHLINEIITKITIINKTLHENQINISLKSALEKNYILSSEIVYKYSRITMVKYLHKLEIIRDALQKLYLNYRSIIKCQEIVVSNPPNPTNIFISINHYRNIFTVISKWFKHGNYDMAKNKAILSFLTADEIYEYYCLLNIIQLIKKLNFTEDEANRKCYIYEVTNNLYNTTKVNNTFCFSNEDRSVILYFQPVIYSYENDTRNNITLFRTDANKNYFTPDFIIKLDNGKDNIKYAIFDSKWSKYDTIKNNRYNEAVLKYLFSIKNQTNLKQVNLMWLLQGRDDQHNKNVFYHNKGQISRTLNNSFQMSNGIVKLTPNIGTKYFFEILKEFLMH